MLSDFISGNHQSDKSRAREERITRLRELVAIQGQNGNWNHDSYMQGMFNGMELALSTLEEREPQFRDAPEKWLTPHREEERIRELEAERAACLKALGKTAA